ncbi:MAG: 2-C-methyl-D-erythritol 4-phosphate cytidylyltransferase [Candidatus Limnocylindrales bacterium]
MKLADAMLADAVIVAAGSSTRMGGADKLAQDLGGRPLLAWSIDAMADAESVRNVVVVTRAERVKELSAQPWLRGAAVIAGGEHRSDSVRAGVEATANQVVLVHDGARPLASSRLADAVARAAAQHGAAVPAIPVVDSLKRVDGDLLAESIERSRLVRTQTPQGARRELLVRAFESAGGTSFSDEAALLEAAGISVATVPGEAANIKVTNADDLAMVRALATTTGDERLGFGEDVHGFGPGDGLMLGGLLIADAPRLYGHSDGDVVLHAIATAVLSAAGLGDLGRLFPATDRSTQGIASSELVSEAVRQAKDRGWRVTRAQVSLVGARPRLGARRIDQMVDAVAKLLDAQVDRVAIVASTGNLSGPEGAGRVIKATALVTVIRHR